jgi:uncharacterized repeat protein (TIGR01451 family)
MRIKWAGAVGVPLVGLVAAGVVGVVFAGSAESPSAPARHLELGRAEQRLSARPAAASERAAHRAYASLPLSFVPNGGQSDRRVRFQAQAGGASFFFTQREAVVALAGEEKGFALRLGFLGADRKVAVSGERRQPGRVNYLLGRDPTGWHTNLPTYREVAYRQLWPGVDLRFHGQGGQLKYELELAPGASVHAIRLAHTGASGLTLDRGGALLVRTPLGTLRDARPVTYQLVRGKRVPVSSRFRLEGGNRYGFAVGEYDRRLPLVIDPGLQYSTYLGGSSTGVGIAVDTAGSAYVTGYTTSGDFPTTSGALDTTLGGGDDAFVTKLNPAGSALAYSTYLGGSSYEYGHGIAVDTAGSAYLTGWTTSGDFPTTSGALDTTLDGGGYDAFVTKLNPAGSALAYSSYLGGSSDEFSNGIAVDTKGSAYLTGLTYSGDFPTTAGAVATTLGGSRDAFVTKLNPAGSALAYSTYLGGSGSGYEYGFGIAVDTAGSAYLIGWTDSGAFPTTAGAADTTLGGVTDAFLTKLNPAGSALAYSTYLGGSNDEEGYGIAVDTAGSAYLTGRTHSGDFPTTAGAFDTTLGGPFNEDAFVTKLNPAGSALAYSTYLGGSSFEFGYGIAVDAAGSAYLTGRTHSGDFPTTAAAIDTTLGGGDDAFVTKLNPAGSALAYSTYLGGSSTEEGLGIAVDAAGSAYLTGWTDSGDFPTTAGAFDTSYNGGGPFVTKLHAVEAPATLTLSPTSATNPVGTSHTVTATVKDASGNPTPGITVRFGVSGANSAAGSDVTDANGEATFAYIGTVAGTDTISAYADTDGNGSQETGEPGGTASKAWTAAAGGADLSVTKSDSRDPVRVGQTLRYTIAVRNNGPEPARRAKVTDFLPRDVRDLSISTSRGSCSRVDRFITCQLGWLASGATATVRIALKPTRTGTLTNTATVSSAASDQDSANNRDTETTTVN